MHWYLRVVLVAATSAIALISSPPTRAAVIPVGQADGVIFSYTAVDTNGSLVVTFDSSNFVTRINGAVAVPALAAEFAQLHVSPTTLTDDIPGLTGHFVPNLNTTKFGITSLTPPSAPNIVFDYSISFGQVSANGLTMTGVVALDPASATSITLGATTYDFTPYQAFTSFTLSLGTQDLDPVLVYNVLKSGNGTFSGTGQFSQFAIVSEPASIVFLGIGGVLTIIVRRRKA